MPWLSSPFPPHHRTCRPAGEIIAPGTIAGILDGDGSFFLARRGDRYVPGIWLGMRDDDPLPFAVATSLAVRLGRPVGRMRHLEHRGRHGRNVFAVQAIDDLLAVTAFLARYPVLSPKGAVRLAAVREATLRLADSRPGPGRPAPIADKVRLRALADALETGSLAPDSSAARLGGHASDAYVADYFAGLVAAEGTFGIHSPGHSFRLTAALGQRDWNRPVLDLLRERLGLGHVWSVGRRMDALVIASAIDWAHLVELLRAHPIPSASPKAEQAALWIEAVGVRRALGPGAPDLAGLRARLMGLKAYRGPRLLCECPLDDGAGA